MICISRLSGRRERWPRCVMSSPSNRSVPAVGSSSRTIRRAVVDLPQPDSPTMPSVSPRLTVRLTPSTACTTPFVLEKTPCLTGKCFVRFSTSTRGPNPARPSGYVVALTASHGHAELGGDAIVPDLALALGGEVAGVGMPVRNRHERRPLAVARLEPVLAPRMERATLRRTQQRRRRALDRHEHVE